MTKCLSVLKSRSALSVSHKCVFSSCLFSYIYTLTYFLKAMMQVKFDFPKKHNRHSQKISLKLNILYS